MPSKQAIEVLKYLNTHEKISRQDFPHFFPNISAAILEDLAKSGYLETVSTYRVSPPRQLAAPVDNFYSLYRITDLGRSYLAEQPKIEKRQRNAEIRANTTTVIAVLAFLLSVFSIVWQICTYAH